MSQSFKTAALSVSRVPRLAPPPDRMSTSPHHAPCAADADPDVDALVRRATQAHAALMRGDLTRYRELISHSDDFTLMAPFGGRPTRAADLSEARWQAIGRFFQHGRDSTLELVQAYRAADLVVLAVIERTHVAVGDIPAQPWALRVTLVFRRQNGRWLLAHRHADPLVEGIRVEESAALARRAPAVQTVTT